MLVYTIFPEKCWAHPLLQDSKTLQLKWSKKRFEEGPVALWDFFESNGMKMHCTPGTGGARPRNRERKRVAEQSGKNRAGERPAGAAACVREREREREWGGWHGKTFAPLCCLGRCLDSVGVVGRAEGGPWKRGARETSVPLLCDDGARNRCSRLVTEMPSH